MTRGLTNRLNFRPTDRQRRLLARYIDHLQVNHAKGPEPPAGLSWREWSTVQQLLDQIRLACLLELPE